MTQEYRIVQWADAPPDWRIQRGRSIDYSYLGPGWTAFFPGNQVPGYPTKEEAETALLIMRLSE
jgi:hypothetical protein